MAEAKDALALAPIAAAPTTAIASSDAQRAVAEVQAALALARMNPRDVVACIDKITNAFTRPSLAEVAQYQYSRGGTDIEGPSIRSAEAIAQLWGNIQFGFRELTRGTDKDGVTFSEVEAFAWDVESNTRRPVQFRVRHWRDTKKGGYRVAEERDIYELVANQAQRRVRACILSVIPGDVVELAMQQAAVTLKAKADTSPEALKKMLDAFAVFDVTKEHIERRIQRHMEAIQPAQVVTLKRIYASLRDGISTPGDWFEVAAPEQPDAKQSTAERVKDKLRKSQTIDPADNPETGRDIPDGDPSQQMPMDVQP